MNRVMLAASLFAAAGCTTLGKPKTVSRWAVLDKAEDVECAPWPMRNKDLRIDELHYVGGVSPGFVVSGVKRDGGAMFYWAPFRGEVELEPESFVNLPLGRGAVVAGGGATSGAPYVALLQNAAKGAVLEVRGIRDNVVRLKSALSESDIKDAWTVNADFGAWVTYRKDDNDVYMLFLRDKPRLAALKAAGATFKEVPVVLPVKGKLEAVTVRKEGGGIMARTVSADGQSSSDAPIDVKIDQELESWSAASHNGQHYVGYVDGDSLVGQAALKLSQVTLGDGSASVAWTRSTPLKDLHASEPVFVGARGALHLLVMQWVDEESTIGRYKVAGGQLGKPIYSGIFPKGSRVMAAFTSQKEGDLFVVVRHKHDEGWGYRICEL
jgi:hypothetical protein